MTANQAPDHGDNRRAAALITHRAAADTQGIRYVMEQSNELNRSTQLLRSTINGYRHIAGELRTPDALLAMDEFVALCQNDDRVGPDIQRAARAVVTHVDNDITAFNQVLIEANNDDKAGGLINGLLSLYTTLLPELTTPYSLQQLGQWTARIAGFEEQPDTDAEDN